MKNLYLATKAGDCLGLSRILSNRISVNELRELLSKDIREPLLVVLDIFHEYKEFDEIAKDRGKEIILYRMRISFYLKLFSILVRNPFEELLGDKYVIGVYIPFGIKIPLQHDYRVVELNIDNDHLIFLLSNILPRRLACFFIKLRRLLKFSLVGLTGFFVNLFVLYLATYLLGFFLTKNIAIPLASIISFETSLTWNFILHEHWTFKDLGLPKTKISILVRWAKFHVGSIGSFLAQVTSVTILSAFLGLPLYLSLFVGVTTGLLLNYFLSKTIAWRK